MNDRPQRRWLLPTRRATIHLAWWLADGLQREDLLILSGDLGAGKTFLTRALLRRLGVPHEVRVTSPTFNLIHEFEASLWVLHADLYRIRDPREVDQLGLLDARKSGAVVIAEWATPFERELGGDALYIDLDAAGEQRTATLHASGPRSKQWLQRDAKSLQELCIGGNPE